MLVFETVWVSQVVDAYGPWPPKSSWATRGSVGTGPRHSHTTQTSTIPQWEKKNKIKE